MPDLTGNFETGRLPKIAPGTVTITIARVPKKGFRTEFERWCEEMQQAVQEAPGCLGATTLHPDRSNNTYQMVFLPRVLVSTALIGATSKYATGPVRKWWRRRRMLPQNSEVR